MHTNQTHESRPVSGNPRTLTQLCLTRCRKVLAQVRRVKEAIFTESRDGLKDHERMLGLALNEAEALAWQTSYPHLLFPALAAEKVQGVLTWIKHQQDIQRTQPVRLLEILPASIITGSPGKLGYNGVSSEIFRGNVLRR